MAEADTGVGAVVLTAAGEHFSTGGDALAMLEVNEGPDERPRLAVWLTKQLINASIGGDPRPFLAREAATQACAPGSRAVGEAFEGFLRDRERTEEVADG